MPARTAWKAILLFHMHSLNRQSLKSGSGIARKLAQEAEIIAKIGRIIGSTLNIDEVYERFAKEAKRLIPFDRVAVNLLNPDKKTITVTYISGLEIEGLRKGSAFRLSYGSPAQWSFLQT